MSIVFLVVVFVNVVAVMLFILSSSCVKRVENEKKYSTKAQHDLTFNGFAE